MLNFAKSEFVLNVLKDGKSVREHYITAWRTTGHRNKLLSQPELNYLVIHIWGWFLELHSVRGSNGFGPSPINYRDMSDWCRLRGICIRQWEINALFRIDKIYILESRKLSD